MKQCSNCGASNRESATTCEECGTRLPTGSPVRGGPPVTPSAPTPPLPGRLSQLMGKRKADIMFILDCTGSMQGEIDAIRDAILSFADTIQSDGVRARVGLIAFRDRLIGEEAQVLRFGGDVFTNDAAAFRREVSALRATGGGDIPESSLDAVMLALRQPFQPDTNKVIVLVTDAPPHVPDKDAKSVDEVARSVRSVGVQQFYLVCRTTDPASEPYLALLEGTKGMAFDLGKGDDFRARAEHFKKTLMQLGKTISSQTT